MTKFELLFLIIAAFFYLTTTGVYFIKSKRALCHGTLSLALLCHLISVAIRWYEAGHPPVFGTYEATLMASWFIPLTALLAVRKHGNIDLIIPWTVVFALLHLAYGFIFNTAHIPLTISEQSIWVDLHALSAWLAYGQFTIAAVLSGLLLYKGGEPEKGPAGLPSVAILDELILKYLVLGFIFHTLMFALGSYYSSILYGKWWTWDPVDTLFMISWMIYGIIIHLRLFYGWKEITMACLVLIAMVTILAGYWSLVYIPWATYHIFDIDLKLHG